MNSIKSLITKACEKPSIYPEIEAKCSRALSKHRPFDLGIYLSKMMNDGELLCRGYTGLKTAWPAYCAHPISSKFKNKRKDGGVSHG